MSSKFRIGLMAGFAALALSGAAQADTLRYIGEANTGPNGFQDKGITSGPASYASTSPYGSASADMNLDVTGGQLHAYGSAMKFGSSYGLGQMDYSFGIEALNGAPLNATLLLDVAATGYTNASGPGGNSYIEFYVHNFYDHVGTSQYDPGAKTYTYSHDPITVGVTTIINVRMIVSAFAYGGTGDCTVNCNASAEAYLDPTFTLLGPNASNYRLVGVPGPAVITPPTGGGAVPEPSAWALMIVGFGAAGASLRRRRVSAVGLV